MALICTVNHLLQACNTVPNPQGFCFLAVSSFHSIITHLWLMFKQVQFGASQCGSSRWAAHTGNYSTRRELLTPEEWDEEINTGVFLQDTLLCPDVLSGQLWPLLLTAATVGHSSCRAWSHPQTLTFLPGPGMGTERFPFWRGVQEQNVR